MGELSRRIARLEQLVYLFERKVRDIGPADASWVPSATPTGTPTAAQKLELAKKELKDAKDTLTVLEQQVKDATSTLDRKRTADDDPDAAAGPLAEAAGTTYEETERTPVVNKLAAIDANMETTPAIIKLARQNEAGKPAAGEDGKATMVPEVPEATRTQTSKEAAGSKDGADGSVPMVCESAIPTDTPTDFGADVQTKAPAPSGSDSLLKEIVAVAEWRRLQRELNPADGKSKSDVSKQRAPERKKTSGLFGNPAQKQEPANSPCPAAATGIAPLMPTEPMGPEGPPSPRAVRASDAAARASSQPATQKVEVRQQVGMTATEAQRIREEAQRIRDYVMAEVSEKGQNDDVSDF